MIQYTIINSAVNHSDKDHEDMSVLKVIHNAGFFSNNTIALMDLVHYFNENKSLPDEFDRTEQYLHYKSKPGENLVPMYFNEDERISLDFSGEVDMPYDCMSIQFAPYSLLPFYEWGGFVNKYFQPSNHVGDLAYGYEKKYNLNYQDLCAVFYRGNDKVTEMNIASYDKFIDRAIAVRQENPNIRFLVQPDETEFLEAFFKVFPDSIYFRETPHISKQNSAVFYEIPQTRRAEYGANFFAALFTLAKCKHLITHSGNLGLWTCLYRGHAENVHQIFNDEWLN